MQAVIGSTHRVCKLPPLILHPFSDPLGPQKLAASSKATLMLEGLLPSDDQDREQLRQALLDGRFCEICMLYYVGKDLARWIEQCLEVSERDATLRDRQLSFASFAHYLVQDAPRQVKEKLVRWGVIDYKAIFERGLGLNNLFAAAPQRDQVTEHFIQGYFQYADRLFECRQREREFTRIDPELFDFDLYASGEYARMLERQWAD